jgi:hypothetical protein
LSRNYGLGSRDMASAGRAAMNSLCEKKGVSFATVDTVSMRWNHFVRFAKSHGIGRMERITSDLVIQYGHKIAEQVRTGEMTPAYAQVLVSAVNTVMGAATRNSWRSVAPVKDCQIPRRTAIRTTAPTAVDRVSFDAVLPFVQAAVGERGVAIALLARELGLRSEEASLIDAPKAASEALKSGSVTILRGTKGGRARTFRVASERQIAALNFAAAVQGKDRSLVPRYQSYVQWLNGGLRKIRETLAEHNLVGLHELRASYACERYGDLTGRDAPCFGSKITNRDDDRAARLIISAELGHRRIDVVSEYIGGRK